MKEVTLHLPIGDDPPAARLIYGVGVLEGLRLIPDTSVQTVVTSPPYFGLRSYGTAPQVWGGIKGCPHEWKLHKQYKDSPRRTGTEGVGFDDADPTREQRWGDSWFCTKCQAWKGELGSEPTLKLYVEHMVEVFRVVWRVLRDDGSLWLNLGDSYSTGKTNGLPPKNLTGVPWRVAFGLQDDGWTLRNEIIWAKMGSCMPEAVGDRCSRNHETIFLFTKGSRYFFDNDAIREPLAKDLQPTYARPHKESMATGPMARGKEGFNHQWADPDRLWGNPLGRNKRTVWAVNPEPFEGSHFAVWPTKLVEPMIEAGTSPTACAACGAPWSRQTEKSATGRVRTGQGGLGSADGRESFGLNPVNRSGWQEGVVRVTTGWEPGCPCNAGTKRGVVLDPFSGSGTTGLVALRLGRDYIGIDLNEGYLSLAEARILGERAPAPGVDEPDFVKELFT